MSDTSPHGVGRISWKNLDETSPHKPVRAGGRRPQLGPMNTLMRLGGVFIGVIVLSVFVGWMVRLAVQSSPFSPDDIPIVAPSGATPNPDFAAPTLDMGGLTAWDGTERVTILLMGADTRPAERGVSRPRTDSMMLLTIDPTSHTAGVLSVPRDLYVDIPEYGLYRINTAYFLGGGDLAEQTVEYNLGVYVDYYVLVEFDAFVTLIDEIGGVDVYVPYDIYDPTYPDQAYGYDPFSIQAGQHHMDGETTLRYVRTRHTGGSDFDRAQRQQDVLFAIRDRILSADMLPTLIQRAPVIYTTISGSIETDMTLDEMARLALLVQSIPRENIHSAVIDSQYTSFYTTPTGAAVLIPDRVTIGPLIADVFSVGQ
jgi:LCP family protein required for cell wall assembly